MIKLEVGKTYKSKGGLVYGPMYHEKDNEEYPFTDGVYTFTRFGAYHNNGLESCRDLIEEFKTDIDAILKPPIGLVPQNIFLELQNKQRVQDILDACSRYNEANMSIPQDWLDELSSRRGEIKVEIEPESEPVVPNYMQDFEHKGVTYSVKKDTLDVTCDDCAFKKTGGCLDVNDTFQAQTGFRCGSSPIRIHFVKKV